MISILLIYIRDFSGFLQKTIGKYVNLVLQYKNYG